MLITPEDFAESVYLFDFLLEKGKVVLYSVVFEQAFLVAISLYMVSLSLTWIMGKYPFLIYVVWLISICGIGKCNRFSLACPLVSCFVAPHILLHSGYI